MSDLIYKGETLSIVLRCLDGAGEPVELAGKEVEVLMSDRRGKTVFWYSTTSAGTTNVQVEGHYVICGVSQQVMAELRGVYLLEIRVSGGGITQIAQVPGVKILDSILG